MNTHVSIKADQTRMFAEAGEAGSVVARQLAANEALMKRIGSELRRVNPLAVVTCARGSSDHAATFAKYVIETKLGLLVSSAAPSISSVYAAKQVLEGTLFLTISQSGASPDLVRAAQAAKDAGATVIALVNVEHSPLAAIAHHVVPLHAGPETSVAATKSYIASLSAILQLVANWSGDSALLAVLGTLPDALKAAWVLDWSAAANTLINAQNFFVVGRGVGFAVAQEAALKFKETSGLHAEAFSAAEVKHGPMAIVNKGFPVLIMSQNDETRTGISDLIADFAARGARVIVAGAGLTGGVSLPVVVNVAPIIEPLLFIQSFYRMANDLAVSRGFDPDEPPHLNKVTETL